MEAASALLERERELDALTAQIELTATSRRGACMTIEGEAGIGKTRLLVDTHAQAIAAGAVVLTARGSELERDWPFGVARQLLDTRGQNATAVTRLANRSWTPVGDVLAAAANRAADRDPTERIRVLTEELYDHVLRLALDSDCVALALTVDDLQWCDDASLGFLAHLALRADRLPVVLIGTIRTGEPDMPRMLDKLREMSQVQCLQPAPLSAAAVETIVRAMLDADADAELCESCARVSAGNPFYLVELIRSLQERRERPRAEDVSAIVPGTVLRSVIARTGRLPADARELALAVAVLGQDAPLVEAAALAQLDLPRAEAAADALVSTGLLNDDEPLRLAHGLVRAALQTDMGQLRWARAHGRAAELLAERGAPVQRISAHLMLTYPRGRSHVVATLRCAAAEATRIGDTGAACRALQRALIEPPDRATLAEVLLELSQAEAVSARPGAVEHARAALELIDDAGRRAAALETLSNLLHLAGDFAGARQLAGEARGARSAGHARHDYLLAIEIGAAMLDPDGWAFAVEAIGPLVARVEAGDPPAEPALLAILAACLAGAAPPAAVRRLAERAIRVDPLIDRSNGSSVGWLGCALLWVDEFSLMSDWLQHAAVIARRRGAVLAGSVTALQLSTVHLHSGRLAQAIEEGERALDAYRPAWDTSPWSTPWIVHAHVERGDHAAAVKALTACDGIGLDRPEHALLLEARARLHLARHEPAAAYADAITAGQHTEGKFQRLESRKFSWRQLAAEAALRLGRAGEADALLAPAIDQLGESGPNRQLGTMLATRAQTRRGEARLGLLERACRLLEHSPGRLAHAHALTDLGTALRHAGQRNASREPLRHALELATAFEAEPLVARARHELAAIGSRPRRAARSGAAALTPTELRIATLAAGGLSNPQIAATLYVARKTVETHLTHIYRKLGVARRCELAAIVPVSPEEPEIGSGAVDTRPRR